jgi:undecaprenyl-diphosphatase
MSTTVVTASGPFDNRHDFLVINDWARDTSWLHGFMTFFASQGIWLFAAFVVAGWWLARCSCQPRRMATALWVPVATVVALLINQPLVSSVQERRPFVELRNILVLSKHTADYGFPSDHATMAGAIAAGILLVSWRLGIFAVLAALLMAFARVYVGVHWPRDVVAGLLLGATIAVVGYALLVPLMTRLVERLSLTRLRPLLTAQRPATANPDAISPGNAVTETELARD